MKIRTGFVSNSSSSSFCIYGASIDLDDEKLNELLKETDDYDLDDISDYLIDQIEGDDTINDVFTIDIDGEENTAYIGVHPAHQKDDQTHKEWKDSITEILNKKFQGFILNIDWHEGEIYN